MKMKKNLNTTVGVALFTAIVVVLQLLGSFIKFGTFSISLVLIPIVVGAAMYGPLSGAWLGLVFGVTVLLSGDAALFLGADFPATILVVLSKGLLCGLITGLVYRAIEKKSALAATLVSAIVCPVVNTGVFLIGCYFFFMEIVNSVAETAGFTGGSVLFLIVGFVGLNFVVEASINIVLSSAIVRIIDYGKKIRNRKQG